MRRGVGLIRVSKVQGREDLISPDLQRTAILNYATRVGVEIIAWREAIEESGSQKRSPWWTTLEAIIREVEDGKFDAVVAWKYNRAARHRLRWAVTLDRIESAGATLESATEGVDTTTSTGRFTRGMLAEIAAFEAERIGEGWKEVWDRRTRLGLGDGQPRFGYDLIDGTYTPNPVWAPVVQTLYERRVQGDSIRSLYFWLRDLGATTRHGNEWSQESMNRMLATGFAAGLLRTPTGWVPGIHPQIISTELWDKYLPLTKPTPRARPAGKHALSGLLVCAYCRQPLHASGHGDWPGGTAWVCGQKSKTRSCTGTTAWGPVVDRLLNAWIDDVLAGKDEEFNAAVQTQPRASADRRRDERRLLRIEDDLLSIARKNKDGFYDDQTYLTLRAELLDERRLLQKTLVEEPVRKAQVVSVLEDMKSLTGVLRGEALRHVLRHVLVRTREKPKYTIVPLWVDA